jgi:TDG/mug DNA glycosylase family protein
VLSPFEERELLELRLGITNIVNHATAVASELTPEELVAGARRLERKVRRFRPAFVAFLGVEAYRTAFARKGATIGRQEERIGETTIWILPNPSGLNAHYQLPDLARLFGALREAAERAGCHRPPPEIRAIP